MNTNNKFTLAASLVALALTACGGGDVTPPNNNGGNNNVDNNNVDNNNVDNNNSNNNTVQTVTRALRPSDPQGRVIVDGLDTGIVVGSEGAEITRELDSSHKIEVVTMDTGALIRMNESVSFTVEEMAHPINTYLNFRSDELSIDGGPLTSCYMNYNLSSEYAPGTSAGVHDDTVLDDFSLMFGLYGEGVVAWNAKPDTINSAMPDQGEEVTITPDPLFIDRPVLWGKVIDHPISGKKNGAIRVWIKQPGQTVAGVQSKLYTFDALSWY